MFVLRYHSPIIYRYERKGNCRRGGTISSPACGYYGGEPSLQLTALLIELLHKLDKEVAVETNGTHILPENVDWITLSPKDAFIASPAAKVVLKRCNEMKVVFTGNELPNYDNIACDHYFLQPCDVDDAEQNKKIIEATIAYCLQHPKWRLSLQTHKLLGIR